MDRSAIILAGGCSSGFDSDKGLLELEGKPLLNHMVEAVSGLADEVIVVTNTQERANTYATVVSTPVRFVVDVRESQGPLVGALS
jgi:molybdopterin-guanine dinucleotide biosynthesis protein A